MENKNSKAALARELGVSRAALYYQPKRPGKDESLRDQILATLDEHPAYGHRRVALALKINHKRASRVMRLYHIRPAIVRRSKYRYAKAKDIVNGPTPHRLKERCPIQPDAVWVGDFTYWWFQGHYIYLATVMDYFTREIIAWQIGLHHTSRLVVDVLEEALRKRQTTPELFHSDQGSEYTGQECVGWLIRHHILPSNSPKGKPWNNGRQESFYSGFKLEFGKPQRYATLELLIEAIGRHIHYYNSKRIHSRLKMSPQAFYKKTKYPARSGTGGV